MQNPRGIRGSKRSKAVNFGAHFGSKLREFGAFVFVLIEFERECDQKRPLQQFRKRETLVVGVVNARDNTVLGVDDTRPTRSRDRNRPMMYALALAAALTSAPAQGGDLKLTNVRMTIGELGPERTNAKFLPGDILFVGYDITGLSIEPDGLAKYKMSMEVSDAAGKSIFKQDPRELNDFIPLRGNSHPGPRRSSPSAWIRTPATIRARSPLKT